MAKIEELQATQAKMASNQHVLVGEAAAKYTNIIGLDISAESQIMAWADTYTES